MIAIQLLASALLLVPVHSAALPQEPAIEAPSAEKWHEISAQDRPAPTEATLQTVFYDVADLVDPNTPHMLAPEDETEEQRAVRLVALRKQFVVDVKRWMEPAYDASWTVAMTDGGVLVASLPPAAHGWTRRFCDAARGSHHDLFSINLRWLAGPPSAFDPFGIERQTKLLDKNEMATMQGPGIEIISSPRLVVFPRQNANVSIINETAYVRDYELVVVAPGDQLIADPIIDVIKDGVVADCRVTPLPDGKLGLWLEARLSQLQRPIETVEITLAEGLPPVTISMPEVRKVALHTRVVLAPQDMLLVTGRSRFPDGEIRSAFTLEEKDGTKREFALFVSVDRIRPEELGRDGAPFEIESGDGVRVQEEPAKRGGG